MFMTIFNLPQRAIISKFNIHGSVHRNNILLYISHQDAHFSEFILSDKCSTYFGYHYHPSSGAQTTVITAPGNRYTVIDGVKFTDKEYLLFPHTTSHKPRLLPLLPLQNGEDA
jgi:hypothetical protein